MSTGNQKKRPSEDATGLGQLAGDEGAPSLCQILRRRLREVESFPSHRVVEPEPVGVQRLTLEAQAGRTTVQTVTHQRVPQVRHVHANLVRAPGVQTTTHGGDALPTGNHPDIGAGRSPSCMNRHSQTRARVAANRGLDRGVPQGHHAMNQCHVHALHLTGCDVPAQGRHGLQGLADHHQTGGVLVQAVHDAGAGQLNCGWVMRQQAIQQGSRPVAGRRMHHQPHRLVHNHEILVLEDHLQLEGLRTKGETLCGRSQFDMQDLSDLDSTRRQAVAGPPQTDQALFDQPLKVAAGELRRQGHQDLVQPPVVPGFPHHGGADLVLGGAGEVRLVVVFGINDGRQMPVPIISTVKHTSEAALSAGICAMKFPRALRLGALTLTAAISVTGCSLFPGKEESRAENLDKLYAEARDDMASGSFDRAIKTLERLEARASGTLLGQQALLDLAYAQWRSGERASALSTIERFIKLHPSSPAYDYALYLRGLVNFNDSLGLFGLLAQQQISERDQKASREAFQAFSQLVQQFPDSKYAADARVRMDFIVNSLAAYEVHVARYYFRRGAYLAAVNRAKQAVTDFDRAPAAEEALAIMVTGYERLGMSDLSQDAQRVLKRNFPNSRFLSPDGLTVSTKPWWRLW